MIRVATGIVGYRGKICAEQAFLWMDLGSAIMAQEKDFDIVGFESADWCGIDYMRNSLIQSAINNQAQWLLMFDQDFYMGPTTHPPTQPGTNLLNMIKVGHEQDAAAVCAPLEPQKLSNEKLVPIDPSDYRHQVIAVDQIGFQIAAINLQWILREWQYPPWFRSKVVADKYQPGGFAFHSPDELFSEGIRKRGGNILCDGRVTFGFKRQENRV